MSSIASTAETGSAGVQQRRWQRLAWAAILALTFLVFYLIQPGLQRGTSSGIYSTAVNLVQQGTFAIDGFIAAVAPVAPTATAPPAAFARVAYTAGHYYHALPPGQALLATPLVALGDLLAPLVGPAAPAYLFQLLAPFLAVLALALSWRLVTSGTFTTANANALRWYPLPLLGLLALLGAILVRQGYLLPLVAAVLLLLVLPPWCRLWSSAGRRGDALLAGLLLGSGCCFDYLLGLGALLTLLVLLVRLGLAQRRWQLALMAVLAGAVGPCLLILWQWFVLGRPWQIAFRLSVEPANRGLRGSLTAEALLALLLVGGLALSWSVLVTAKRRPGLGYLLLAGSWVLLLGLLGVVFLLRASRDTTPALPIIWHQLAVLLIGLGSAVLVGLLALVRPDHPRQLPRATGLLFLLVVWLLPLFGIPVRVAHAAQPISDSGLAAPFAIESHGVVRPLWQFEKVAGEAMPTGLRLPAGSIAVSPWTDVWPGTAYAVQIAADAPVQVVFAWESVVRNSIVTQAVTIPAHSTDPVRFAAPPEAAGLHLRLSAPAGQATVTALSLTIAAGVAVSPFPNGQRAALAFSFDWESAMGGLIHSRTSSEGEGTPIGLQQDGGPSVAEAEAKALRMREGADFLQQLFAQYGIHATFYATGYNLLPGNPTCTKFLGNPIYRNADQAHGWGSDWWRAHPWFENDPCGTEASKPAWYFASQTLALAQAGHEIGSHTFGHLYVRGVTPEQLSADLALWQQSVAALQLPRATTFAFPWTSSNSLDDRFWTAFEQQGFVILTRLYQTKEQPLRRPFELDRIASRPGLIAFPDYYLASRPDARLEALVRIDQTLAMRGYHSLWNHPNEVIEQGGQAIWQEAVAYAAAQRDQGLWLAPVGEIAQYSTATRQLMVTALPLANGVAVTVQNQQQQQLAGVTVQAPGNGELVLPIVGWQQPTTVIVPR